MKIQKKNMMLAEWKNKSQLLVNDLISDNPIDPDLFYFTVTWLQ